jgi:cytochrome c-type biogenesis protein CcmH/NrfG
LETKQLTLETFLIKLSLSEKIFRLLKNRPKPSTEEFMDKASNPGSGYVKKSTVFGVALICLAIGFFVGVIFSSYSSGPSIPQPQQASAPPVQPAPTADRSQELDTLIRETSQNPKNVGAWIDLGNLYFDTNQFDKAIWAYQKSIELQHDNPNVLTEMGVMYRRKGQPEEALKAFDKAINVDPKHEVSRFNKGIVLLHDLKKPQEAIRTWEALLKVNPFAMAPGGKSVDELVTIYKKSIKQQ